MRTQRIDISFGNRRTAVTPLLCIVTVLVALFGCQDRSALPERPTVAVLPIEAADTREETKDLADHLTKRFRNILSTRPEIRVTESGSALEPVLAGLQIAEKAQALDADYLLTGTLGQGEGRLKLALRLLEGSGEEIWEQGFESPLIYQAQLQGWIIEALWQQLPLEPQGLEGAMGFVANCHYPDDAMAILTLARTGRRGGGPASLAMVATADIEAGLLHLAQSRFYFGQIDTLPPSQQPVVEKLALRSLGRAVESCPQHPHVELLRLIHTNELELDIDNAADYLDRHPNSVELYLAAAELYAAAGSHRRAQALAREASLLDPLGEATRCRTRALLESPDSQDSDCP
jgi:TolB-like protein